VYTTDDFETDQWQSPYPYLPVSYTSTSSGNAAPAAGVYAGVFGAIDNDTGQCFDILCKDMGSVSGMGQTSTVDIYSGWDALPTFTGVPGTLSSDQRELLTGIACEAGITPQSAVGICLGDGQYMIGAARTNSTDPTALMSLTDAQAAAYQLLISEVINEPFDSNNPLANIGLTGGALQFYQADGTPFSSDFISLYNGIAETGLVDSGLLSPVEPGGGGGIEGIGDIGGGSGPLSVPEPLPWLSIPALGLGLLVLRWQRNRARRALAIA